MCGMCYINENVDGAELLMSFSSIIIILRTLYCKLIIPLCMMIRLHLQLLQMQLYITIVFDNFYFICKIEIHIFNI